MVDLTVGIKGAGEMASAIAWRLYQARIHRIFMMEIARPLAVRRMVSFCETIYSGSHTVERVAATHVDRSSAIHPAWEKRLIAVGPDPTWSWIESMRPHVVIDAILAKKNLGTSCSEAPLVIGVGPGFTAPGDVHLVVETQRGHDLGRVITTGAAAKNTGIPGDIGGFALERVLRAPVAGCFETDFDIGDTVRQGDIIGEVDGQDVIAVIGGVLRGLIRSGVHVEKGLKLGDIDPRGNAEYCQTISDKARAISGSILECIMRYYNSPERA